MSFLEIVLLTVYTFLLLVLLVYAAHAYVMVFLYRKAMKRESMTKFQIPNTEERKEFPHVTIQLPIYNEQYVVERLLRSVCSMEYPKDRLEVQVLDDSTDNTTSLLEKLSEKYREEGIDIVHIHRKERNGFKSGALRRGLEVAKGEYVAIFDADFTPPHDFLLKTIPYFYDDSIGVVQVRWGHLNADFSLLTRGEALGLDGHFQIEQTARNKNGMFINFNGTCGIWRKEAILDSGNWQDDTLTEDMDLSYRAQLRGWKFVYLPDVVCPGEIPAEVNAFKIQQHRWAKGAIQTAKKILPSVWRSSYSLFTKLQATIHLTNHTVFPVLLIVSILTFPLLLIKVNTPASRTYFIFASLFTVGAFSYPVLYIYSQKEIYRDWKKRVLSLPVLLGGGIGISVNNSKAFLGGLFGKRGTFDRTPKYCLEKKGDSFCRTKYRAPFKTSTLLEVALCLYTFAGLVFAMRHKEYSAVPFLLLYCFGYGYIGGLSLLHALKR